MKKTYVIGETLTEPLLSGWRGLGAREAHFELGSLLPGWQGQVDPNAADLDFRDPDSDYMIFQFRGELAWALAFLYAPGAMVFPGYPYTVATTPPEERAHRWLNDLAVVVVVDDSRCVAVYLRDGKFSLVYKEL